MDTRILEYFVTVAQENNLSRAAEKLYISQPALSQRIKALEQEVGAPLLRRQGNRISLTEAGIIFFNGAQSALYVKNQAYQQLQMLRERTPDSFCCLLQPELLPDFEETIQPAFERKFPSVALRLRRAVPDIMEDYLLGGLAQAACLLAARPTHPELEYHVLCTEELVLALAADHPWGRAHDEDLAVELGEFAHQTFLLSTSGTVYRELEKGMLQLHHFAPLNHRIVREREAMRQMVRDGVGVALLLRSEAQADPGLRFYRLAPTLPAYHVLAHSKSLPATEALGGLIGLLEHAQPGQPALPAEPAFGAGSTIE